MNNEIPQFSRTGVVAPMGTLISELRTKVDSSTEEAFKRLCHEADTDVSGALRNWVYLRVHGKTYDQIVYESMQRRAALLFGDVKTVHALQGRDEAKAGTAPIGSVNGGSPTTAGEHS